MHKNKKFLVKFWKFKFQLTVSAQTHIFLPKCGSLLNTSTWRQPSIWWESEKTLNICEFGRGLLLLFHWFCTFWKLFFCVEVPRLVEKPLDVFDWKTTHHCCFLDYLLQKLWPTIRWRKNSVYVHFKSSKLVNGFVLLLNQNLWAVAFLTKYGRKICKNLFYRSSSSYWGLVSSLQSSNFEQIKRIKTTLPTSFPRLISETKFTQSKQIPSCLTLYRFFHPIFEWVLSRLSNPIFLRNFGQLPQYFWVKIPQTTFKWKPKLWVTFIFSIFCGAK